MIRSGALLLIAWATGPAVHAQHEDLAARHARITAHYKQERYADVVRETNAQLTAVAGTPYQDSLHLYLYKFGRASWKAFGADAAVEAAERVWSLVDRHEQDPGRRIAALGDLSWIYYELGRVPECVRVDSMALTIALAHAHQLPPKTVGKAHHYLGFDLDAMGDHARALRHFLAALKVYEQADSIMPIQIAETCTGMGVTSWRMGRIRDAERYYQRSLATLANDSSIEGLARRSSAYGNLGLLWQDAGDLARSKEYYLMSVQLSDRIVRMATDPARRDQAIVERSRGLLNLATVYFATGDHRHSRELLERTLRDRLSVLEPDDPQVLRLHESFAELELAENEPEAAVLALRTYLEGTLARYGRRSGHYVMAAAKLARAYAQTGRTDLAEPLFQEAIAIGSELIGGEAFPFLATIHGLRGEMHIERAQWVDATADLARARTILKQVHGPGNYRVVGKDVLLARTWAAVGDTVRALAHADSAWNALQDRVQALQKGVVPPRSMQPHLLPDAIYWKVRTERALGRSDENDAHQRLIDLAITSLQRDKSTMTDENSRLTLIGAQQRLFDLGLELAYARYQQTGTEADLQRFLDLSEADRAILLKSRLNAFSGMRFAGVPDEVVAREQELLRMLDVDPDASEPATDLLAAERAYAAFLDSLSRDHPRYFALRYGDEPVSLADVRHHLITPQRHLLVYAASEDELYALVVRPDTAVLMALPMAGLAQAVEVLTRAVAARATDAYLHAAHDLYQRVFAPVAEWLTGDELLIVPDGPLHNVNFEVLLQRPSTLGDLRRNVLLQRYAIAQQLSVTTAVQYARMEEPGPSRLLALAPGFTDDMKQRYVAGLQDTTRLDRGYLRLVRQPFTVLAAQELGRTFTARVLLGDDATEQHFRQEAAQHGVLHLGTHAEMNPVAPMFSRLVLSKGPDTVGMDGYLHAFEIYELDLQARLAVLTACETGTGRHDAGEGVRSLGHAFAYAGCPSLVLSLWKIDEKVSADIIARFYRNLAQGQPKHKALRQAKLDHLAEAQDELVLPYYWAGMMLVGEVSPVEIAAPRWPRVAVIPPIVLGLLIGAWYFRRRRAA